MCPPEPTPRISSWRGWPASSIGRCRTTLPRGSASIRSPCSPRRRAGSRVSMRGSATPSGTWSSTSRTPRFSGIWHEARVRRRSGSRSTTGPHGASATATSCSPRDTTTNCAACSALARARGVSSASTARPSTRRSTRTTSRSSRAISSVVAGALRAHVREMSPWLGQPSAPGLVVIDRHGSVVSANAEALPLAS